MYSLPSHWGSDPIFIYALFDIVFFGMMFSDAGYGLLMAIGCFVIKTFHFRRHDLEDDQTLLLLRHFHLCVGARCSADGSVMW